MAFTWVGIHLGEDGTDPVMMDDDTQNFECATCTINP
jgi:hypothetical protein